MENLLDPMGILDETPDDVKEKPSTETPEEQELRLTPEEEEVLRTGKKEPVRAEKPKDPNRVDVSIVWLNGQVMLQGPSNPIMLMRVLGDALSAAADEYLQIARKAKMSALLKGGPQVPFTDKNKDIINAADKEIKGG